MGSLPVLGLKKEGPPPPRNVAVTCVHDGATSGFKFMVATVALT